MYPGIVGAWGANSGSDLHIAVKQIDPQDDSAIFHQAGELFAMLSQHILCAELDVPQDYSSRDLALIGTIHRYYFTLLFSLPLSYCWGLV